MIPYNRPLTRLIALSIWLFAFSLMPVYSQQEAVPVTTDEEEARGDQERVVVYPDADEALKDQTRAERSRALKRRAGEQIGDEPQGRAGVLGMYVQEADGQRVKVVEVGAATPAFEAGIRKGDVIVSFDGFKADSYRKWVDGIRKLVSDAPEGDTMPIQLVRDGKRLNLRLRKQVARADDIQLARPDTLNQQTTQQQLQPQPIPVPQPTQGGPGYGSGGGVGLLGGNFFGSQFSDVQGGATEVAVAEIFPVLQGPRQSDVTTPDGRAGTQRRAADGQGFQATVDDPNTRAQRNARTGLGATRIGIAGFRDSDNGLLVMVDVGGLAPGNYLVGIGDPGMVANPGNVGGTTVAPAGTPATTPQRMQNRTGRPLPPEQDIPTSGPVRADEQPANGVTPPARRAPAPGGAQPQSRLKQTPIPRAILAQIIDGAETDAAGATDGAAATGAAPVGSTPATGAESATGQNQLLEPPAAGEARSPGRSQTNGALDGRAVDGTELGTQNRGVGDLSTGAGSTGSGTGFFPSVTVGMLTVDQSGTGRLQQVVDGVQVQHVVGQAIVISTEQVPGNTRIPANLNAGASPAERLEATRPGAVDRNRTGGLGGNTAIPPRGQNQTVPQTSGVGQTVGNRTPVAAGIIRVISDRRPNDLGDDGQQPSANLPATGQELR